VLLSIVEHQEAIGSPSWKKPPVGGLYPAWSSSANAPREKEKLAVFGQTLKP
jgi:hypothetical protein